MVSSRGKKVQAVQNVQIVQAVDGKIGPKREN
jgi:hypothetical protein